MTMPPQYVVDINLHTVRVKNEAADVKDEIQDIKCEVQDDEMVTDYEEATVIKRGRGRPKGSVKNRWQGNPTGESSKPKANTRGRGRPQKDCQLKVAHSDQTELVTPKRVSLRGCPVRERKPKEQYQQYNAKWGYEEKQRLFRALKMHSTSAVDKIQAVVKTKSKYQISAYLMKIHKNIQWRSRGQNDWPILKWINMARDLVGTEAKDYTSAFSKVMSIVSNFETHPTPTSKTPDYSSIYRYLSMVLEGKELPVLGPLESAIILDLLHSVVNLLERSEATEQTQVMKWKHDLLSTRVDTANMHIFLKRARKALSNDFSDFEQRPQQETVTHQTAKTSEAHDTQSATNRPKTPTRQSTQAVARSSSPTSRLDMSEDITNSMQHGHALMVNKLTVISHELKGVSNAIGLPSVVRKRTRDQPPCTVIAPDSYTLEDMKDVLVTESRTSGNQDMCEGKLSTVLDTTDDKGEKSKQIEESESNKRNMTVSSATRGESDETCQKSETSKRKRSSNTEPADGDGEELGGDNSKSPDRPTPEKRGRGRPSRGLWVLDSGDEGPEPSETYQKRPPGRPFGWRKITPEKSPMNFDDPSLIPKKPSLYTLNPFCVPVKLLKLPLKPTVVKNKDRVLPATPHRKKATQYNPQKMAGITSVNVHRMAAKIPQSKQHVLLPNAASQKVKY